MTIENDFLLFATDPLANVLSQTDYVSEAARPKGFVTGQASSTAVNKTLRQSSIVSAMIAQFIVDQTSLPAIDDGTIATLEANFITAISNLIGTGRLLGVTVIGSSGTFTPNPNANTTIVEGTSGGGAGGGARATNSTTCSVGSGGNCGAYAKILIPSQIINPVAVVVGLGGTGVVGGTGGAGGDSSFGSYLTLPGGLGGLASTITPPPFFGSGNSNGVLPTISGATTLLTMGSTSGGGAFSLGPNPNANTGGRGSWNVFGNAPNEGQGTGGNGANVGISSAAQAGTAGLKGGFIVMEFA